MHSLFKTPAVDAAGDRYSLADKALTRRTGKHYCLMDPGRRTHVLFLMADFDGLGPTSMASHNVALASAPTFGETEL